MHRYFALLLLLSGCGVDREFSTFNENDAKVLVDFHQINDSHQIRLGTVEEQGQKLIICLNFIDAEKKEPLFNSRVHFYHADINGEYQPRVPGDETTARLSGGAITDDSGRILLQTILPGDYGSSTDNRHIHTTVFGAKPEGYDIHFKQYTDYMNLIFIRDSDQHFLADLKRDSVNNLVAYLTIEVKNL